MKKIFTVILGTAIFSMLVLTPVLPQLVNAATTPETTDEKIEKTLDNRIQQYKKDHPNTLTLAQAAKLKGLCKAAQAKTKKFTQVAVTKGDERQKLYEETVKKLDQLTKKIESYESKEVKLNTAELKKATAELKTKVETFKLELSTYQVALNDLSTINCQELTETFKAALEEVRQTQKTLVATSGEIKKLITDSIKPEIEKIKLGFEVLNKSETKTETKTKTEAKTETDTETEVQP